MARKPTKKQTSSSTSTPAKRTGSSESVNSRFGHVARRGLLWLVIVAAIGIGGAAAFSAMQRAILQHRAAQGSVPFDVQFAETPHWMPPELARHLQAQLTPTMAFSDERLCADVYGRACRNPWIAQVQSVRRERIDDGRRGIVRVTATFRQPVAAARHEDRVGFVDAHGVLLPYEEVPRWAARQGGELTYHVSDRSVPRGIRPLHIHYVLIDGVAAPPPPVGKVWLGDDLQDGLRLAELLKTRPYASQITAIDVRNHNRRISDTLSEIVFYAQKKYGGRQSRVTKILFGRFPNPDGDWVITPDRKMTYLDRYTQRHDGRIAGHDATIDLRHDNLVVSSR